MKKEMRDYKKMLDRMHCQIVEIKRTGKHTKIKLRLPSGQLWMNLIPSTSSDCYWIDANRQLIQRVIREDNQQTQPSTNNRQRFVAPDVHQR